MQKTKSSNHLFITSIPQNINKVNILFKKSTKSEKWRSVFFRYIFFTNIRCLSCAKRRCFLSHPVASQMLPISRSIPCSILINHIQQKSENAIHGISVKTFMWASNNSMSCRNAEYLWQKVVKTPQEYWRISRKYGKIMPWRFRAYARYDFQLHSAP